MDPLDGVKNPYAVGKSSSCMDGLGKLGESQTWAHYGETHRPHGIRPAVGYVLVHPFSTFT